MRRVQVAVTLWFIAVAAVSAQEGGLRRGYRAVELGMSFDAAQQALRQDAGFAYRGEPDVSLRLSDGQSVIDSAGNGFIRRALLQFASGELYILALYLDRQYLDYFALFGALRERYGDPDELSPDRALWRDERTRIELERPLTVRYLDIERFEQQRGQRRAERALLDLNRERFLEEF